MDKKYNGWANYETWNIKLWLDNDEGSQEMMREWAEDVRKREDKDDWAHKLADIVKDFIEENNPLSGQASMYSDLMQAAIDEADFDEIAEAILEDFAEDEAEEVSA